MRACLDECPDIAPQLLDRLLANINHVAATVMMNLDVALK
jgi:hypothetical protein